MHGERDRIAPRSHSEWLTYRCPLTELRPFPDDGHISVMNHSAMALEWLRGHAGRR